MAPITKLIRKIETFLWTKECQKAWKLIKQKYIEALILISPNWQVEFHVHTYVSLLVVEVMLSQNVTRKRDQPIVYVYRLLNIVEQNHNITKRKVLTMVFSLHRFKHYLSGKKFFFNVDHMALVYLVNKPQVSGRIARWLLQFFEYDFIAMYKLGRTHVIANALSRLQDNIEPTCVPDQTTNANLFYIVPKWLNDVNCFLKT